MLSKLFLVIALLVNAIIYYGEVKVPEKYSIHWIPVPGFMMYLAIKIILNKGVL